jgi:hypothetical protein
MAVHFCFGLQVLGACSYDLSHPPVFLPLGGALSTLTLVLTFLQLTKPEHRFRIAVRRTSRRIGIIVLFATFLCACCSAVLQVFHQEGELPYPVVGYSVFWEWLGAIFAASGLIVLARAHLVPVVFRPFNARTYERACRQVLNSASRDAREALALELYASSSSLVQALASRRAYYRKAAEGVFEHIAADSAFCRELVEQHPVTIAATLARLNALASSSDIARLYVQQLARQAFSSDQSALEKEVALYGEKRRWQIERGRYPANSLMCLLFGNAESLRIFKPFRGWRPEEKEFHTVQAQVRYREAVLMALWVWLDTYSAISPASPVETGFENIWRTLRAILERHQQESSYNPTISQLNSVAYEIGDTVEIIFELLREQHTLLPKAPDIDASTYSFNSIEETGCFYDDAAGLATGLVGAMTNAKGDPQYSLWFPHEAWGVFAVKANSPAKFEPLHVRIRALILNNIAKWDLTDPKGGLWCKTLLSTITGLIDVDERAPFTTDCVEREVNHLIKSYFCSIYEKRGRIAAMSMIPDGYVYNPEAQCLEMDKEGDVRRVTLDPVDPLFCRLESKTLHSNARISERLTLLREKPTPGVSRSAL